MVVDPDALTLFAYDPGTVLAIAVNTNVAVPFGATDGGVEKFQTIVPVASFDGPDVGVSVPAPIDM